MELPKQYPLAVAAALAINIQCYSMGLPLGQIRRKIFNEEFMRKNFGEEHQRTLGEQVQRGGYPDTGSGVYSQKLSYNDWYRFNVLQRIHLNYVQNVSFATTATLAAAIYKPKTAASLAVGYMIARLIYATFYKKKGGALNPGRIIGVIGQYLALLGLIGVFGVNFWQNYLKK